MWNNPSTTLLISEVSYITEKVDTTSCIQAALKSYLCHLRIYFQQKIFRKKVNKTLEMIHSLTYIKF